MERYSVLKLIGEGSFGRALLVEYRNSGEKYVLKEIQLSKNLCKSDGSRREAVLLSKMKHPNIVAFREAFEAPGQLCIVMEYCSGGDLLHTIQQQKSMFSIDDILKWFAGMCAGAKHIHDKRVLHRDLKSKNIFLTHNGTVKLGDFGSACVLNSPRAYAHTYVGTPYYVSPEIWDNKPYNNKSDVWSLGCVLYELCTLRHPFQASSWRSLILKVCRGAYPPLPSHLPYELHLLVRQMFKTRPRDRPSLTTILSSHRVSRLLRGHLPPQVLEEAEEKQSRRGARWRREEGESVATLLGEKSLIASRTLEGMEGHCRKKWSARPSDSLLHVFNNAPLLSSDSLPPTGNPGWAERQGERARRKWDKEEPERLLALLEKAGFTAAFSTFTVSTGTNPLVGPLSRGVAGPAAGPGDVPDGTKEEVEEDEDRLEHRSDEEDTDFDEESPYDWMEELEKTAA